MHYIQRFLILLICTGWCFILSGCHSDISTSVSSAEPPAYVPDNLLTPSAPQEQILGYPPLTIDISNLDQGYCIAKSEASSSRIHVQILSPDQTTYSYFIEENSEAIIPFTCGNGSYSIICYQQIQEGQYAALFSENVEITLQNEFLPFLYPNQYVFFTADSEAVKTAQTLISSDAPDIDVLDSVYTYVVEQISYDTQKANSVKAGYLPDIDETLRTKKGICFDYAALITAMLRSRSIPCKLQIGYSSDIKHAWIDVYIRSKGWIQKAIVFDEDSWTRMDPTFDSNSQDQDTILSYIGDDQNYTVQFTR